MSEDKSILFHTQNYIEDKYENQYKSTLQVLNDTNNNGKIKDWNGKKKQSLKLASSYGRLGWKKESQYWIKRSVKVTYCGSVLTFKECLKHGYKKLVHAQFCKDRLCPMCNWRRSRMLSKQVIDILHSSSKKKKMDFLFLTLTVKNCHGKDLNDTIKSMFLAFNKFFKYKSIDDITIGYVRALEVTRNKRTGEFHPHFHVLIGVSRKYFKGENYIKHSEWVSFWQKALGVDYLPTVNVKKVRPKREGQTIEAASYETAKYTVKDADFIIEDKDGVIDKKNTDEAVYYIAEALYRRRLIAFGKLFKEIRKELKLQDIETDEADLVGADEIECKCPICQSDLKEIIYKWNIGINNYVKEDKNE